VTSQEVIGPYSFETEGGGALTVTGVRYRDMIENCLRPVVENRPEMWFQQDGATAHTARATMDLLRQLFGELIISRNSQINWPPRSPDLSAPDYFLWGYLKERMYVNKPRTLEQLRAEIRALDPQTLTNVMNNAIERARLCEAANGAHLKDAIFYT
jgi:hypothetical protein